MPPMTAASPSPPPTPPPPTTAQLAAAEAKVASAASPKGEPAATETSPGSNVPATLDHLQKEAARARADAAAAEELLSENDLRLSAERDEARRAAEKLTQQLK